MKQAIDQTRQMWNESDQRKVKRQELLEKDRIFTLANLLSIVWFDLFYGFALGVGVPKLIF